MVDNPLRRNRDPGRPDPGGLIHIMSRMHDPAHPGEVLKDGVFGDTGLTVTEFARRIGVSRVQLSRLLNDKAGMTADMALRLADALGGTAESWLEMQANYDLWQARQKPRPKIERLAACAVSLFSLGVVAVLLGMTESAYPDFVILRRPRPPACGRRDIDINSPRTRPCRM